jgi:hypothetical protein
MHESFVHGRVENTVADLDVAYYFALDVPEFKLHDC